MTGAQVTVGTPVFGELHKDDVILEIQSCDASRLTHKQAQDMIRNAGGSMVLRVRRSVHVLMYFRFVVAMQKLEEVTLILSTVQELGSC